jgi:epoxide hydrolase 4
MIDLLVSSLSTPGADSVRLPGYNLLLHTVRAGRGQPVILLHGFPEFWYSWRRQIPALAEAGLQVIAPDLRGYNLSDRPTGRDAYRLDVLVEDVAALVRSTGHERAHVVGHDWGGVIAWAFAHRHPEMLDRLVILNAPHPVIYGRRARRPPQLLRSWYALFFQLPVLPELVLGAADYAAVRWMLTAHPASRHGFPEVDVQAYVRAIERPGALTAALNYYRANLRPGSWRHDARRPIEADTLLIWGGDDPALDLSLLDGLEAFAPRLRIEHIPRVGHWVHHAAPDRVNRLLIDHLT